MFKLTAKVLDLLLGELPKGEDSPFLYREGQGFIRWDSLYVEQSGDDLLVSLSWKGTRILTTRCNSVDFLNGGTLALTGVIAETAFSLT